MLEYLGWDSLNDRRFSIQISDTETFHSVSVPMEIQLVTNNNPFSAYTGVLRGSLLIRFLSNFDLKWPHCLPGSLLDKHFP